MSDEQIKVVMFSTSHISAYAALAAEINESYCQVHGYQFKHYQYDNVVLEPGYEKVRILQREFGSAKYLLWIDSDAVFVDFRQPLGEYCQSGKDLVLSGHEFGFDPAGRRVRFALDGTPCGLNTGVVLIRCSLWSRFFLDQWWRRCVLGYRSGTAYWEQGVLQQMLMDNVLGMQSRTHLVTPCSRLNRCDDNGQDVCEFILHLWGASSQFRHEILSLIRCGQRPQAGPTLPNFSVPDLRGLAPSGDVMKRH